MPAPCNLGTFHGPLIRDSHLHGFARNDCKRLSCAHCGPRTAARYRKRIVQLALQHGLTKFITLTLDPAKLSFFGASDESQQSVAYIRSVWCKFRVYLGRYAPTKNLQFILVVELQGDKAHRRAHLHLLVNRWIDQAWIDETWKAIGGGHTWIEHADIHRVAAYVSKYVTKQALESVPKGKKRVSCSQGMPLHQPATNPGWRRSKATIEECLELQAAPYGPHRGIVVNTVLDADTEDLRYFEIWEGWMDFEEPAEYASG